ncbi:MAG: amidohydrolase family protein [Gemmatimonadota bacterium]|nr:amidohydrolase family protein [Gemmatimonadota bacterium]
MTVPTSTPQGARRIRPREFLVLVSLAIGMGCGPAEPSTAYVGATVWDGTAGAPILDAAIVVRGGRIERIGPAASVAIPRNAEVVRLDGTWVIPGLIDAHTHAERWTLNRFLAYGVTSVRDVGGVLDSIVTLRDEVQLNTTLGPRMFIAGAMIDGPPATRPDAIEVATAEQARQAVDRLVTLNASHVKLYTRIDEPLLRAVLDEAQALDVPVTAHLGKVDAVTAASLGLNAIEHMTGVVEASVSRPEAYFNAHDDFFTGWNRTEYDWATLDSAAIEGTIRELLNHGVTIVPTLALHEAYSRLTDAAYIARLDLSGVPLDVQIGWDIPDLVRRAGLTATDLANLRRARAYQDRFVRYFNRAGGDIAAGSDSPNQLLPPGASLHDELQLLVRAGLSPRDALLAATRTPARLIRADSLGVLRSGAVADFVVLNADPLLDIANTRRIDRVVFRGIVYAPAELMVWN